MLSKQAIFDGHEYEHDHDNNEQTTNYMIFICIKPFCGHFVLLLIICNSYYTQKGHWNVHEAKTKGCPYCGKKFSRPVYLNDHVRSHTGEKPFQCNICLKKFGAKRNLTQHKKVY